MLSTLWDLPEETEILRITKIIVYLFDRWSPFVGCIDEVDTIGHETRKHQSVSFSWYIVATAADIPTRMVQFVADMGHSQFVNDLRNMSILCETRFGSTRIPCFFIFSFFLERLKKRKIYVWWFFACLHVERLLKCFGKVWRDILLTLLLCVVILAKNYHDSFFTSHNMITMT